MNFLNDRLIIYNDVYILDSENISLPSLEKLIKKSSVKISPTSILIIPNNKGVTRITDKSAKFIDRVFHKVIYEGLEIKGKNAMDSYIVMCIGAIINEYTHENKKVVVISNDRWFEKLNPIVRQMKCRIFVEVWSEKSNI